MGQGSDVSYSDLGNIEAWYHYILDYMGNNRMAVNRDGTIEQITHYYLYGPRSHRESIFMLSARRRGFSRGQVIGDISTNENLQKFKFEGKELDRTFGLDSYDVEARQYFAMAPVWDRMDPLAEKYYGISPYAYCASNPINNIDLSGDSLELIGEQAHLDQVIAIMNANGNSQYTCQNGQVIISRASEESNNYDKLFSKIINSSEKTSINVVFRDPEVTIANGATSTIDIYDISKFENNDEMITSGLVLGHELYEQFEMQTKGKSLFDAHQIATGAESYLSKSEFKIKAYRVNGMNYEPRTQTRMNATFIGENIAGETRKKHFAIVGGNIF